MPDWQHPSPRWIRPPAVTTAEEAVRARGCRRCARYSCGQRAAAFALLVAACSTVDQYQNGLCWQKLEVSASGVKQARIYAGAPWARECPVRIEANHPKFVARHRACPGCHRIILHRHCPWRESPKQHELMGLVCDAGLSRCMEGAGGRGFNNETCRQRCELGQDD